MTASRLGLVALAAIAVALGALLAWDLARGGDAAITRELLPGVDVADVTAVEWSRAGRPAIGIVREGSAWSLDRAVAAADPATVDQVLAALRGARWHRRAEISAAGAVRATVEVTAHGRAWPIGLAAPLAGGEQAWVVIGDRALLVDAWVVRALDPEPLALRVRAPLADASGRVAFRRGEVVVEVDLARGALVQPAPLALAPERVAALAQALAALVITRASAAPIEPGGGLVITAGGRTVELAGVCPDAAELDAIHASTGDGCVPRAAISAIAGAVSLLVGAPEAIADLRPVAARPARVRLLDGATLELAKRPQLVTGTAAEDVAPERVAELLAGLAAPGAVAPLPAATPRGALVVTPAGGGDAVTLDVYADGVVARRGEPVALRIAPEAYAALVAPSTALRDATLWTDEPTAITRLVIDGVAYARGDVIGEWSPGADPAAVEALASALAAPRVSGADTPPPTAVGRTHHIAVEVRSPVGDPIRRELDLEQIGKRCALRAGGRGAWIAPSACAWLARSGTQR